MNSKIIMGLSALVMGLTGIVLTFFPEHVAGGLALGTDRTPALLIQAMGGLYFGFGMLNWMSRASLIGGIYNRPVAIANFSHFFVSGIALIKGVTATSPLPGLVWGAALVYLAFSVLFGGILFRDPLGQDRAT